VTNSNIAQELLLVAADAPPHVADALRAVAGVVATPGQTSTPAPLTATVKDVRDAPVDEAVALVGYIREPADLDTLMEKDRRVSVRIAVAMNPHTKPVTRLAITRWLAETDRLGHVSSLAMARIITAATLDDALQIIGLAPHHTHSSMTRSAADTVRTSQDLDEALQKLDPDDALHASLLVRIFHRAFESELPLLPMLERYDHDTVRSLLSPLLAKGPRVRWYTIDTPVYLMLAGAELLDVALAGDVTAAAAGAILEDVNNNRIPDDAVLSALQHIAKHLSEVDLTAVPDQHLLFTSEYSTETYKSLWRASNWATRIKMLTAINTDAETSTTFNVWAALPHALDDYSRDASTLEADVGAAIAEQFAIVLHRGGMRLMSTCHTAPPAALIDAILALPSTPSSRSSAITRLLIEHVRNNPERIVQIVAYAPELLIYDLALCGGVADLTDAELLDAVYADNPDMCNDMKVVAALGERIFARPWGAEALATTPALLAACREMYPHTNEAHRVLWSVLRRETPDDPHVWQQVAAGLSKWTGSVRQLVLTARATVN
jgi:hypothetical protein